MSDTPNPQVRIGWLTVALGVAGLLRLIPELLTVRLSSGRYFYLIAYDVGLDAALVVLGLRLVRQRPWSAGYGVMFCWGILLTYSTALLCAIIPDLLLPLRWSAEAVIVCSRLLWYGVSLAAVPYVIWVLRVRRDVPQVDPGEMTACLVGGVVLGLLSMGGLVALLFG